MLKWLSGLSALVVLAALALFTAFLLNVHPKGVDIGAGPPGSGLAGNLGLLAAFGLVHSLLARPAIKRRLFGARAEQLNRPVYLLVTAIQLMMIVAFWSPMTELVWRLESTGWVVACWVAFCVGMAVVAWAIVSIDPMHFFGLRQVFWTGRAAPPFSLKGPYRYVRHPIQSGLILALWAAPVMTTGHALMAAILTVYAVLATLRWEEKDLETELGQRYADYRRDVPAFLPWL